MAYHVRVFNWGRGFGDHLRGKPRFILVCDWSEDDLELSYEKLKATKPAFAEFYIGTHQHLYSEKLKFADALCKSLNDHLEAVASLQVKV